MSDTQELADFTEFEVKFRVDDHKLIEFKQIMESILGEKRFIYVEGPDFYYTHPDWFFKANPTYDPAGTFIRYRKPSYGLDNGRCEVTWKIKLVDAKNNIKRTEHNWRVDGTPDENIRQSLTDTGARFNFAIVKTCHIYIMNDATVVFYTVYDVTDGKPSKAESFLEIEVREDTIKGMPETQAWQIIEKYEAMLAPLGVTAKNRLRKSLFAMYHR